MSCSLYVDPVQGIPYAFSHVIALKTVSCLPISYIREAQIERHTYRYIHMNRLESRRMSQGMAGDTFPYTQVVTKSTSTAFTSKIWMGWYTSLSPPSRQMYEQTSCVTSETRGRKRTGSSQFSMKTQIYAWLRCEVCRKSKFILSLARVRNSAKSIDKFGIANLYLAPSTNQIWRGRKAKASRIKKYRQRYMLSKGI